MKNFTFRPTLFQTLRQYNKATFMSDLMAGIIVGIVALPLAIAFGIASGVSPTEGIITAVVAGFIISALGGSKVQIGGPTGAFIVIIYGIIQQFGIDGLLVATMMAGVLILLLGLFKLGTIVKYIPYPIIVGFTSGIAVTIFTTQIKDLFGLSISEEIPADFVMKWGVYFKYFDSLDLASTLIGLASVAIIALTPRLSKKIPGSLVAIILMTVVGWILRTHFGIESIETIGDRFVIEAKLPTLRLPFVDWETIQDLAIPAITIATLGAIESLLSAAVADGATGSKHDSNQELVGQGIANILTPLFGGIAATGAIARTMTNINNGGKTPIAGIIHAVILLLIFLFLMPLAGYIPMACLAGVLVVVSYHMSEWKTIRKLLKNPKSDVAVLLITFFLTVIFDLTVAIMVGLVLSWVLFMRRTSEATKISVLTGTIDAQSESEILLNDNEKLVIPEKVQVYEIDGPYFFGMASRFEEIISRYTHEMPKVRIIRMRKIPFIDSTGIYNLSNLCKTSQENGVQIILSGVKPEVRGVLERNGFDLLLGEGYICENINTALQAAKNHLED